MRHQLHPTTILYLLLYGFPKVRNIIKYYFCFHIEKAFLDLTVGVRLKPLASAHIVDNQIELCKIQMLPVAKIFAKLELIPPFKFGLFL